jgi:transposase InsO family protein
MNAAANGVEPAPSSGSDLFEDHMEMVRAIVDKTDARQEARRLLERRVRERAVDLAVALAELGHDRDEAARRLGLNERTLRQWEHDLHGDKSAPIAPLGRPLADSGAEQQQAVLSLLNQVGPGIGVPTLRTLFPDMARSELTELKCCHRDLWQTQHTRVRHTLHWQRPGIVWAMDFAQPPAPIDGQFPYLLAVRDLASGRQLLWRPVHADTAQVVITELTTLFLSHGAPWVMKTDNGPAFIADQLARFLGRFQTFSLFSPVRTPSYNGSIEASICSLKKHSERLATLLGHPGIWTGTIVEAARREANATARPRRLQGATPDDVWFQRRPLTADEREQFRATVCRLQHEAREQKRLPLDEVLSRNDQAKVDRLAIPRALVAHDLLVYRRRSIPAPIKRPKVTYEA